MRIQLNVDNHNFLDVCNDEKLYLCSNCDIDDIRDWYKFCPNCGSSITWSHEVKIEEVVRLHNKYFAKYLQGY